MSTDIAGWVEIKVDGIWTGVIEILPIMNRNYYMFNLLFGGRNSNYDDAIAGNRGIPDDHSHLTSNGGWNASWIGWDELQAIDWSLHEDDMTNDWRRLFELMDLYSQVPVVTDVRLIVSFF